MSIETSLVVSFRELEGLSFASTLLDLFSAEFVIPRSAEIHLPGREVHRFRWSLDYDVPFAAPLPTIFAGEVFDAQSKLSHIEDLTANLRKKQISEIKERLHEFRSRAEDDYRTKKQASDDVHLTFWGPSRIGYLEGGSLAEGWFLRQEVIPGRFEPICRVNCDFGSLPQEEFVITLRFTSDLWSCYKRFNQREGTPVRKSAFIAERHNAIQLARIFESLIQAVPKATVQWGVQVDGHPDLSGFVRDEFRKGIGKEI